jgi:bifunctional UDP-N-acetylglucosamine pyrophosphorylase/glucosamine-1-phosphate N-acetyltransferase
MSLHIVILAAGQGKRMNSNTPKPLFKLGGKEMLRRVVETAQKFKPEAIHVVVGYQYREIETALSTLPVNWVMQSERLGTGHALLQALPNIPQTSQVLVLSADVPLIAVDTLSALIKQASEAVEKTMPLVLLVAKVPDPKGFGRILRDDNGQVISIIEEKDADEKLRQCNEIYSGICIAQARDFMRWLPQVGSDNAQGEYYLTQVIALAATEGLPVVAISAVDPFEVLGVNDRLQLGQLERHLQYSLAKELMIQGVSIADPLRIDIRGELCCGKDVFIDINCIFSGSVVIGDECIIGANVSLNHVTLGKGVQVLSNSVLEHCNIGDECAIGPFARLRPGTELAQGCKIGNFVETKNAKLANNSKASHLSYLGDVMVGKDVNIGAGTITCNYDGVNKYQTVIGDGVFIGSDSQLIAPVVIGDNATIGAGSTICKDVPAGELTLTEAKQKTIYGWQRPKKDKSQ